MRLRFRRPTSFLILSILLHLGLWLSFYIESRNTPPPAEKVEIVYDDVAPQKPVKATKTKRDTSKQVVEQDKQFNEETPDKDFYLSKFDQKVVKQMRAKDSGAFRNKQEQQQAPKPKKNITMADLVPGYGPKAVKQEDAQVENTKVTEGSQTDDYLKEMPTGLQTLISTREFVFYAYYARIKEKIRQQWEPQVREKVKIVYRQGRSIASATDRITRVIVTLNSKGELLNVEVVTQSGVQHLDDAATGAFKSAAPFPNPPQGMIEQDGLIRIRWDFILEA